MSVKIPEEDRMERAESDFRDAAREFQEAIVKVFDSTTWSSVYKQRLMKVSSYIYEILLLLEQ